MRAAEPQLWCLTISKSRMAESVSLKSFLRTGEFGDPWIIRGGLRLSDLVSALDVEGISYEEVSAINFGTRQLTVNSSITLIFKDEEEEFSDWVGLCKVSAGP